MKSKRIDLLHHDIPTKANRILNLILFAMLLILVRVWHLAVIEYDQKMEESRKPQKKTLIEPATRATIRDRFNRPLAINKIQYQAAILYSQIKDIPSIAWELDESGKKVRKLKRKEYIHHLSVQLARELELDAERIEDLIHAKASYYSQVPYIIKQDLTEKEYYRLKFLEKDWPGIYVRKVPKRHYPEGRVAADVIGYMGAINRQEYEKIIHEMSELEQFINDENEEHEFPTGITNISQARKRFKDLEEKAYTSHDYIGKTGIEGSYEKLLRGFYGKKSFYTDSKGNFLQELAGTRPALSGRKIVLTISSELQEYGEQLLALNESIRDVRLSHIGEIKKTVLALKHPWIKGGAIVVMNPKTGELLTLATFPRFDPNDFVASGNTQIDQKKKANINRWFENEDYLASLWNEQQPLEREEYNRTLKLLQDTKKMVTWSFYLDTVLPTTSPLREVINTLSTIEKMVNFQKNIEVIQNIDPTKNLYQILNFLYPNEPHVSYSKKMNNEEKKAFEASLKLIDYKKVKNHLDRYFEKIPQNYDKVLLVDFSRLSLIHSNFSPELIQHVGPITIDEYKTTMGHFVALFKIIKKQIKELYHQLTFKEWRKKEEKGFLKEKRVEEKKAKTYPKPYLDYLDHQESILFNHFWENYKWHFFSAFLTGNTPSSDEFPVDNTTDLSPYISFFVRWHDEIKKDVLNESWVPMYQHVQESTKKLSPQLALEYFKTMRSYEELNRPLLGRYRGLRDRKSPLEKHLASAFYPCYGYGCGRSNAYRQSAIQGSIFKLVTAYEVLVQNYRKLNKPTITYNELNPLVMVDQVYTQGQTAYVGYTKEGKPIPQQYKGGRIPRSLAHQNNGEVDLIRAFAVSSNPYFSLLAGEFLENPDDLSNAARLFSYGSKTGLDLPGEIAGKVPKDLTTNRTGLYALAIGQHSLVVTPLQTAVMLSAIANGGEILKPKIVAMTTGREPTRDNDVIVCSQTFPYQDNLALVGIDFPLFSALSNQKQKSLIEKIPTEIKRKLFMPNIVRTILLKGLRASVQKTYTDGLSSLSKLYARYPEAIKAFSEYKNQIIGKTSTSESVETIDLDSKEGTNIYTHVWFGGITLSKEKNTFILEDDFGNPELVIVVYLRYGGYGKEAAPLATQMAKKWQEIKTKYQKK